MRKGSRKMVYIIMMSFLFVVLLNVNGIKVHATTPEASIGKKNYATLQQAINKVKQGQTIKLKKNVKLSGNNYLVIEGKKFTLDLNKKTITYTGGHYACRIVKESNVIVKNGTVKANGQKEEFFYNQAELTLNNVTCKGGIYNEHKNLGGEIWFADVFVGYIEPTSQGKCIIESGTYTEPIYNYGYMKIKGGKFTSNTNCIVAKDGALYIEGGNLKSKESPIYVSGTSGSGLYSINVYISGGVLQSTKKKPAIMLNVSSKDCQDNISIVIRGGTIYKSSKGKLYENIGKEEFRPKVILFGANLVKAGSKIQNIKVKNKEKTYTQTQLKEKARSFSVGAKAKGKLSYKVTSGTNYISVNKKGKITIKKGTPVGVYKVKVMATAVSKYNKAEKEIIIVIKE